MGHRLFHIPVVEAVLSVALYEERGNDSVSRFTRAYYVWARDEEDALELIKADLSEEATVVSAERPIERHLNETPHQLRSILELDSGRGVAWRSGRVFFHSVELTPFCGQIPFGVKGVHDGTTHISSGVPRPACRVGASGPQSAPAGAGV